MNATMLGWALLAGSVANMGVGLALMWRGEPTVVETMALAKFYNEHGDLIAAAPVPTQRVEWGGVQRQTTFVQRSEPCQTR